MDVLRGASFPHLVELGICSVEMEHGAVESLVARSPVLEILNIEGCRRELRLRLVSQSLRCVQICSSVVENITMVKAPCLERLILSGRVGRGAFRVRIVDAPKLHTFGFLEPGQVLEVGKTAIMPGIKASTSTMLTTVKILSLNVRFGVRSDVEMVPTFLRCFPNVERLHIMSKRCDQPIGNHLTRKFWEESGPIENVVSRIHTMCLREFRGDTGEVGFLEFFFGSARSLRSAFILMANPLFTPYSTKEADAKGWYGWGSWDGSAQTQSHGILHSDLLEYLEAKEQSFLEAKGLAAGEREIVSVWLNNSNRPDLIELQEERPILE
ncbi:hypothetical protein TRIUR3_25462 [Triticum urartu]|uniref:FBD domain-containing protein n=1 Tax=Triticum urartu TaxID=4572 RepID=M7ZHW4_TRIUA|nr:hypothetical protein TRIUR3_25462 [Triticum urartu]